MSVLLAFLKALPAFWNFTKLLEAEWEKHEVDIETKDAVVQIHTAFSKGDVTGLNIVLNNAANGPPP